MKNLEKRLFPCVTTNPHSSWRRKIKDAEKYNLKSVSFFPEFSKLPERKLIYPELLKSKIKHIPHLHLSDDSEKWELDLFFEKFGKRFFNIHENNFDNLKKWPGYEKYIYLEYNYNNNIPINFSVEIKKIGGLCVDFSHFWSAKNRNSRKYAATIENAKKSRVGCNHLNGYSYKFKRDLHFVRNLKSFDYLKEIPEKYFSQAITIEVNNSISEQLAFKKYIIKLLS